ncbi:MAG: sulfatase-like hydrolase/transferase [Nitrospiraceae bacterium]|nr:sulfatase-like hydrolase/transferase [Nitrospiraceae bacterium]
MPKKLPNIVIFAIDSIRRDHMSCYGYPRLTTPHFDRLAAGGTLVENSFSPYIPTTPAYSSILTGRDVIGTQMPSLSPKGPLDKKHPTLPEILRKAGYTTTCVGFDGGFYRGFNKYLNFEGWVSWEERPARKAENMNAVTLPAIDKMHKSGKPFLLFLRHMDPHAPYLPPSPYDTMFYSKNPCARGNKSMKPVMAFKPFADFLSSWMPPGITDKDFVIAQYDGELAYMDACSQRIITRLEELGIVDDTLIVITGDHGETLYDHECFFDHHGLYEPTLVVPLIYYWPGKIEPGVRSKAYTLHEDLIPTVLDLCGLKKFAKGVKFDGVSIAPYLKKPEESPRSEFYISECTWMRKQGWRTPIWKFWEALEPDFHNKPPVELYNLIDDPEESVNLADKEPQVVKLLRARMNAWIKKRCRQTGLGNSIEDYELGLGKRIGSIATAKKLQSR